MKEGLHLILDLKECKSVSRLSDKSLIRSYIIKLVRYAEMKAITTPKVLYYEHEDKAESGVTGFVIIADSHISIHTYPFKRALYLDLFSCKKFDHKKISEFSKKTFRPKISRSRLIKR